MKETGTGVENQRFRHSKLVDLVKSLETFSELHDRILAAIDGEAEFERVRKRLVCARMYLRKATEIAKNDLLDMDGLKSDGGI